MSPDQFQGDSPAAAATREAVSKVTGVPADQIKTSFAAAPGARRLLQVTTDSTNVKEHSPRYLPCLLQLCVPCC
jgi:hypothetical protein